MQWEKEYFWDMIFSQIQKLSYLEEPLKPAKIRCKVEDGKRKEAGCG